MRRFVPSYRRIDWLLKYYFRASPNHKGGEAALVNLSAPQVPSSRAKPRDLYCTAAICTHAPSLKRHLGASFFAFPSLTIYRSARRIPLLRSSGHARKTDRLISFFIPLRKVVPLRGTLSCAFGAALLQGPTRIVVMTGNP